MKEAVEKKNFRNFTQGGTASQPSCLCGGCPSRRSLVINLVVSSRHDLRSRVAEHASGYHGYHSRGRPIGEKQIRRARCARYRAADPKAKSFGCAVATTGNA